MLRYNYREGHEGNPTELFRLQASNCWVNQECVLRNGVCACSTIISDHRPAFFFWTGKVGRPEHRHAVCKIRHLLEELSYQVKSLIGSQFSFVKCKAKEESRSNLDGVPTVKEDSDAQATEFSSQQVAVLMEAVVSASMEKSKKKSSSSTAPTSDQMKAFKGNMPALLVALGAARSVATDELDDDCNEEIYTKEYYFRI
ncbi:hypothetical protein D8674_028637 [Pyrus ussuriensis x Pyrus communis]|uniref:Uncharacterized protein n=1 Tax=Pyrus ussuriensis x Pyrus communis TaxID=2448454 RepID=A0A5N5I448_9ROSA|nr:hypothetical protein D8674_028637 [Pyrus ussuriensis x Pyrus communis]